MSAPPSPPPSYRARPVVLLTFANDIYQPSGGYLRTLAAEQVALSDMLGADGHTRRYQVVVDQTLTRARLRTLIERHRAGIVGFHFGGHADSMALHLANLDGHPDALAADDLAEALATLPRLRWVCLNACATEGHVDELHRVLAAPVVVTERAVRDAVARAFAVALYRALIDGSTLEGAFAIARTAAGRAAEVSGGSRMLRPAADSPRDASPPWRLVAHPDAPQAVEWTLTGELAACSVAGRLAPPERTRLPRNAVAQLLVARHQVVPFAGRAAVLAELDRWAADPEPVRVRLIHGIGGAGKTRLLVEWLRRQAVGGADGPAGFLRGRLDAEAVADLGAAPAGTVVIDAAETRPGLAGALEWLARRWSARTPGRLRVVLLAGNAGDWWSSLRRRGADIEALLDDSPPPLALDPLVGPEGRAAEYERARAAFAAVRRRPETAPPAPPDLSDRRFERVLYLHLAALATVDGLPARADVLLNGLLDEERRLWLDRAGFDPVGTDGIDGFLPAAEAFLAAVTLRGGVDDRPAAEALAGRFQSEPGRLVRQMRDLHFAEDDWIGPLEPAMLGQALVAGLLDSRHWPCWIDDALAEATAAELTHGFVLLGHLEPTSPEEAQRAFGCLLDGGLPDRAVPAFDAVLALGRHTAHSRLGQILAEALRRGGTLALAAQLDGRSPASTTMLREVAAWVDEVLVADGSEHARIGRLLGLVGHLLALGRARAAHQRSLEALTLAAQVLRAASEAPGAADSAIEDLGRAWRAAADCLLALRAPDEALGASDRAVKLQRALVGTRSLHGEGLAAALDQRGRILARMGRSADALVASEEAVAIGRVFADAITAVADGPALDRWLPRLADWVGNHGVNLAAVGRKAEARAADEEVEGIYRRLARLRPDAYLPALAGALVNLAVSRQEADDPQQALSAAREAVVIFRRLAHNRPAVFLDALAAARDTLATVLGRAGAVEEAAALATEDLPGSGERGSDGPALAGRARQLYNAGGWLHELGRSDAAAQSARASVEAYRALYAGTPLAHGIELARALESVATIEFARGDHAPAIERMIEAVEYFEAGHAAHPGLDRRLMALSLRTLAGWQLTASQWTEAAATSARAVELSRTLAEANPVESNESLARALGIQLLIADGRDDYATGDRAAAALVALTRTSGHAVPIEVHAVALAYQGCRHVSLGRLGEGRAALHAALPVAWAAFEASNGQCRLPLDAALSGLADLDGPPDKQARAYRARLAAAEASAGRDPQKLQ